MASPGRNPQRSLQSWRLLNEGFKLFTTRLGGNRQHMCIAGISSLNNVELFHQMTGSTRLSQRLAAAQQRTQVLEERNRKLKDLAMDKSDLFESRGVMLCSRVFELSQELIVTRMRINDFENACTQLRRRILELKLRRVQRRRLLCHEVQQLRLAQEQQVPPILMRLWHCLRFLWNCVECLAQVTHLARPPGKAEGKMDALNLFVAGF
ncbi:hypothetical protein KR084_008460 [Drosophila pseudotakahashii]|nr:hypothetical protein KR084_008460 [Drosophila pseudotakahashii]